MNKQERIEHQISMLSDELEQINKNEKPKKKPFFSITSVLLLMLFIFIGVLNSKDELQNKATLTADQLLTKSINDVQWEISAYRDVQKECDDWKRAIKTDAGDIKKMDSKCDQAKRYLSKQLKALDTAYKKHGKSEFLAAYKLVYPKL